MVFSTTLRRDFLGLSKMLATRFMVWERPLRYDHHNCGLQIIEQKETFDRTACLKPDRKLVRNRVRSPASRNRHGSVLALNI